MMAVDQFMLEMYAHLHPSHELKLLAFDRYTFTFNYRLIWERTSSPRLSGRAAVFIILSNQS